MVTQWGMSDNIGPLHFKSGSDDVFLGREISYGRDFSDKLSSAIDSEVSFIVKNAEKNAIDILNKNIDSLHNIAKALLDRETISGDEMKIIIKNGNLDNLDDFSSENSENSENSEKRKRRTNN